MRGPLREGNEMSGWRSLDNVKLRATHHLAKRNASLLPEAVKGAGENQGRREGIERVPASPGEGRV